jgi:hypothetical protein
MARVLTPCLPWKSCLICEARLFPKAASPEKKAAKYLHQAAQYGTYAANSIDADDVEQAYAMARAAGRFASMAVACRRVAA